ncbi:MAG: ABC transporter ATP-binding protein, partial [Deltaproteobacteria bacterium]|nr:ABC transporter ATP-binding protein [Deltaproteobacteria bacterium]
GCATLHAPEVLLLDEPTSGVDPIARDAFWRMIRDLAGRVGVTVLVTTHYLSEAEACERLALLDAGRLVALGSPAELRASAAGRRGHPLVVECDHYREALRTLRAAGLQATLFGRDIHVLTLDFAHGRARIEAALAAVSISARVRQGEISLENAFIAHVEDSRAEQGSV